MPQPGLLYVCEICQTILHEHHCKAICPNCGRMFDCSDLPLMAANAQIDSTDATISIRAGSDIRDWMPQFKADPPPESAESALP
jgi:uncharacterized Zn finger protein (UPF0148 family)